jgi:cob(I)alamin adenosyltransferase
MKPGKSGEVMAAEEFLPGISVFGKTSCHDPCADQRHSPIAREESRLNFETASGLIASGDYDLVVLDELNIVLYYDFLSKEEVLPTLMSRPEHVDIVITGRHAPDWLIEAADLVTEMVELKHPCADGLPARIGIEL